jgi:hypothetical protein
MFNGDGSRQKDAVLFEKRTKNFSFRELKTVVRDVEESFLLLFLKKEALCRA